MSYLVFCSFDLKNASSTDYQNAYADLKKIGLTKVVKTDAGGDSVIPTTAAMGFLDGVDAATVRSSVRTMVKNAFTARGLKSEIFVIVGGNWAWGATTT